MSELLAGTATLIMVVLVAACYLAPTLIAVLRRGPDAGAVAVINVLLGWTALGWIVALALACRSRRRDQGATVQIMNAGLPPDWRGRVDMPPPRRLGPAPALPPRHGEGPPVRPI